MAHVRAVAVAVLLVSTAPPTHAQQAPDLPRAALVCVLRCGPGPGPGGAGTFLDALALHGYEAGANFVLDQRSAGIAPGAIPTAAVEVVRRRPDVVVVFDSGAATRAMRRATPTIPIVAVGVPDIESDRAATAGGATPLLGVSLPYERLLVRQLALLREVVPGARRIAVVYHARNADHARLVDAIPRLTADDVGETRAFAIEDARDAALAIEAAARWHAGGVVVLADEAFSGSGVTLEALRHRLPTIGLHASFVHGAGLMSYGPDPTEVHGQGGEIVAKLLGGARPGPPGVEQPGRFRLTVNGTTARALGLVIPASLLLRADHVVE